MTDEDDCRCDCDHCEMSRELKVFKKMIASLNFRIVIIENARDLQTQKTKELELAYNQLKTQLDWVTNLVTEE